MVEESAASLKTGRDVSFGTYKSSLGGCIVANDTICVSEDQIKAIENSILPHSYSKFSLMYIRIGQGSSQCWHCLLPVRCILSNFELAICNMTTEYSTELQPSALKIILIYYPQTSQPGNADLNVFLIFELLN